MDGDVRRPAGRVGGVAMNAFLEEQERQAKIRAEWLAQRRSGIGSSDAACLIGLGWNDAASVYRSKVDSTPEGVIDNDLQRGIDLEPIVARKYAETMGKTLVPAGFVRSLQRPWQFSNPDFVGEDDRYTEIKTTRGFDEEQGWGEPFTDAVPAKYLVQCQHQMGVRGNCDHMDLAAFDIYGWRLRIYRIAFDQEFFDWLTTIEERAWREIEARRPLGVEWEDQFREECERRVSKPGTAKALPDTFAAIIAEMHEYRAIEKEAGDKADAIKKAVAREMGTVERATAGPWSIKRTVTTNNQVRYTFTNKEKSK